MSTDPIRTNFNLNSIKFHIDIILKYIKDKNNAFESELYIMETYPDFYQEYPFLVKQICKKEDLTMLYKMFGLLNNIENNKDTLDNVEKNLGQELAHNYVFPHIKNN